MKWYAWVFCVVIVLVILGAFVLLGWKGKADHIILVYAAVGAISGLVFTVAGLWAGFVYPEAIRVILSNASTDVKRSKCKEYKNILLPVVIALCSVVISSSAPIFHALSKELVKDPSCINVLKISAALTAGCLVLILGWSIWMVVSPSIHWFAILSRRTESDALADKMMPKP